MEKKQFIKEADINIKNDFLGNSSALQDRIITEAFKVLPFMKDLNYKLDIKNVEQESGSLRGLIDIFIPEKNNKNVNTKVSVPVLVIDYKMKPLDTVLLDNHAFPATDSTIKELLISPETFRTLTIKELKETRILSKIAVDHFDSLVEDTESLKNAAPEVDKKAYDLYLSGIKSFNRMAKNAEKYSEPITDCIIQKAPGVKFDIFYVKSANDNDGNIVGFKFMQDRLDSKGVRTLMESMGYDSEKMAEELTSKREIFLKSPATNGMEQEAYTYNPAEIRTSKLFVSIPSGPARVVDFKGVEMKGVVFDLFDMNSAMANNFPKGKIFLDYKKNYYINGEIQGVPDESGEVLKDDNFSPSDTGILVDPTKNIAFGPIKILSVMSSPDDGEVLTVNITGKKYKIRREEKLKTYLSDGNEILIPYSFQWYSLKKKISLFEANANDMINAKIASHSFTISKQADDIRIVKFLGNNVSSSTPPVGVPSINHLKLLLIKMGMVIDELENTITNVKKNKQVTFFSTFPFMKSLKKHADDFEDQAEEAFKVLKKHSEKVACLFPKLFDALKEPSNTDFIDKQILQKEGASNETLDTIFSLGIVNEMNSNIFLQNIDKLKFTISFLTLLRLYIRLGWDISVKEPDLTTAIDAMSEIISGLELVKAQKLLDKQLQMQNT